MLVESGSCLEMQLTSVDTSEGSDFMGQVELYRARS
jgi:hypothetical protein